MNRRSFLKVLSAIGAGVALRPLPVLGEQFSVLEAPAVFASAPLSDVISLQWIQKDQRLNLWGGVTVPDGWLVCDGTNGTPDLRSRHVHALPSSSHPSLVHSQKLDRASGSHQHPMPSDPELAQSMQELARLMAERLDAPEDLLRLRQEADVMFEWTNPKKVLS